MKKTLLSILALTTLSTAGASEKIGAYLLGVQYERDTNATDSVRFGLGLPLAGFFDGGGAVALSGDVSYLRHTAAETETVQPYYGAGLGLSAVLATGSGASVGGVGLYPNVLAGANFNVTDQVSLFAEGSVGPVVAFAYATDGQNSASGADVGLGYNVRLGVNYKFR
ncbi:hypothetical protein GCM10008959_28720 [Deinococcus seoulensis]|uniref:Outer membrane protein beta-barrel domain-containing protein n=1 Tax=Deinococcus seoulensis TaxID=1837379 RepID=A0ABQ2RX20_9DEIO|nr:hypothetical protein [Deinococcus seoulensis]GGR64865.1 hypothetical protein GCM10008959_28720 [Deinococcus seoulensis]